MDIRLKSERVMLNCPCCSESFRVNKKKSRIIQEANVGRPLEKKNPFIKSNEFVLEVGKMSNSYDQVVCMNCGNMFAIWIRTKPISEIELGRIDYQPKKEDKNGTATTMVL